jgi:hypothetical protein
MMAILAPSNPQTYNRQAFLFISFFIVASAAQRPIRRGCPTSILPTTGYVWRNVCRFDRHRERAARRAAVSGLGRQERREPNAAAKNPHPTQDELPRIIRWSFSVVRLHSGPFVSVTVEAAIS